MFCDDDIDNFNNYLESIGLSIDEILTNRSIVSRAEKVNEFEILSKQNVEALNEYDTAKEKLDEIDNCLDCLFQEILSILRNTGGILMEEKDMSKINDSIDALAESVESFVDSTMNDVSKALNAVKNDSNLARVSLKKSYKIFSINYYGFDIEQIMFLKRTFYVSNELILSSVEHKNATEDLKDLKISFDEYVNLYIKNNPNIDPDNVDVYTKDFKNMLESLISRVSILGMSDSKVGNGRIIFTIESSSVKNNYDAYYLSQDIVKFNNYSEKLVLNLMQFIHAIYPSLNDGATTQVNTMLLSGRDSFEGLFIMNIGSISSKLSDCYKNESFDYTKEDKKRFLKENISSWGLKTSHRFNIIKEILDVESVKMLSKKFNKHPNLLGLYYIDDLECFVDYDVLKTFYNISPHISNNIYDQIYSNINAIIAACELSKSEHNLTILTSDFEVNRVINSINQYKEYVYNKDDKELPKIYSNDMQYLGGIAKPEDDLNIGLPNINDQEILVKLNSLMNLVSCSDECSKIIKDITEYIIGMKKKMFNHISNFEVIYADKHNLDRMIYFDFNKENLPSIQRFFKKEIEESPRRFYYTYDNKISLNTFFDIDFDEQEEICTEFSLDETALTDGKILIDDKLLRKDTEELALSLYEIRDKYTKKNKVLKYSYAHALEGIFKHSNFDHNDLDFIKIKDMYIDYSEVPKIVSENEKSFMCLIHSALASIPVHLDLLTEDDEHINRQISLISLNQLKSVIDDMILIDDISDKDIQK